MASFGGLKERARRSLLRRGLPVPAVLVRRRERRLYEALNRLTPGGVVFDFGANIGQAAELFALKGAQVHAFEPHPEAFRRLRARLGEHPAVVLHNVALGAADGIKPLYLRTDDQGRRKLESSSLIADKANVDAEASVPVRVLDAAAVLGAHDGIVDLLKIDVEGAEYAILNRLIDAGALDRVRQVVVETHADRAESLRLAHSDLVTRISRLGLCGKIRLDWK
jgi:FkbM family methyltransferase